MVVSGRLTPFLLEMRPATSTIVSARPGATRGDAQQHLAVVDQHAMAGPQRVEDFRMRQKDARLRRRAPGPNRA